MTDRRWATSNVVYDSKKVIYAVAKYALRGAFYLLDASFKVTALHVQLNATLHICVAPYRCHYICQEVHPDQSSNISDGVLGHPDVSR